MSPGTTTHVELRAGGYVDSVTLMQVSRTVSSLPGVESALVAMATPLNVEMAAGMGFEVPAAPAPNKMLVAIRTQHEDVVPEALAGLEAALRESATPATGGSGEEAAPRTIMAAAARDARASVALISTPGQHAFAEAIDAIDAGLHTMVFSDNVPVEQEVALKRYAERVGVLVMGPDCGTAVVGGVGLGFANVVRPGPVGIVAASGTGAQQLMTLLADASIGVSHCLGVGGRDLSAEVGGLSTTRALDLLAADEDTELIVLVSKPPADSVAARLREHAESLDKPVVFGLLGPDGPDLTEVAEQVVVAVGAEWHPPAARRGALDRGRTGGFLRGLYAGGTLCSEAALIASARLTDFTSSGHTMTDFGDDRFTRGRPHPMIDGTIRAQHLLDEVAHPSTGVILLDVVLGYGASQDPAAELVGPISEATRAGVPVVVAMIGTGDDPQRLAGQTQALHEAGAWVFSSNAAATRRAVDLLTVEDGETR